ncbi:hypothetical protein [Actinoplanes rectilineatus]|uniref:hypothetical protein n=1 Tax=Actinoplanes rectilineatus TaxID=113571 RepID=UPI0005F2979C|nr:hypothetical protein [Actinoplanes rectilineatus]
MLLAYLDESYSTDWYYMAALLCDGPGAQAIPSALDAAVDKAVKTFGVPENAELHGYELFNGTGWWRGVPVRARIGVYNEAFAAIGSHGAALVLRGMNVAHHRTAPYSRVLPTNWSCATRWNVSTSAPISVASMFWSSRTRSVSSRSTGPTCTGIYDTAPMAVRAAG